MQFKPELNMRDFPSLLQQVMAVTGDHPWRKRLRWIKQQLKRNPFLEDYITDHHGLELAMPGLRHKVKTLGNQLIITGDGEYRLASFIAGFAMIYERLPKAAQKRLRGSLLDGLTQPEKKGLLSLQHEITVATHILEVGFDVIFTDLEDKGRFDFLASRAGIEMEIECKMVSGDMGRKVPRVPAAELFHRIHREIANDPGRSVGTILQILLPDRLAKNEQINGRLAAAACRAIRTGTSFEEFGLCSLSVSHFAIRGSPFDRESMATLSVDEGRAFFEKQTGVFNPNLFIAVAPNKTPTLVAIESVKPDNVLESIFDTLSASTKAQLTGGRASILCVQVHDLSEKQLLELAKRDTTQPSAASGLQLATSFFLNDSRRDHVLGVVFRSHGSVEERAMTIGGLGETGIREHGVAYAFGNPRHIRYKDPAYKIFTQETWDTW